MRPSTAPRTRRVLSPAAILVALVVTLVAVPRFVTGPPDPSDGSAAARPTPSPEDAVRVRIHEVRAHTGPASVHPLRASGTLEARRHAVLAFAVSGVVDAVLRDEGDEVTPGTALARLDPIPFESAVERAEARVDHLEKSLARSRRLLDQRALSDEEFDAQDAELTGARAELRLARWNLDRSVLRAPFAGHVLARHAEEGEVVGSGVPAFELIELRSLEVEAALPASDLSLVDLDGPVTLVARDDPRLRATGSVEHAPLQSDTRSGSVPLRLVVDNEHRRLLPGMVVQATFSPRPPTAGGEELRVPLSALRIDDQGQAVWRVDARGRVERVDVEVGPVRGDRVVITGGLRAGDRIVDEAPDRLRAGDAVVSVERGGEPR
ncbi:MAG TPA: efflux RND transporter periplasmic adaptor subunit [Candidatus Krumholzibacteria bacterium]|nr:efflux RND transporter periplasmic adaptor subunit [Candidatus Krumholzibacteria bacterium]